MKLSVIIPTHNPAAIRLRRTVAALRSQSLPTAEWELVIVDNASEDRAAFASLTLGWHPAARVVHEPALGLTPARHRGLLESAGEVVVFVDDDNLLDPEYLQLVTRLFQSAPKLGAAGGRSVPEFEIEPAPWQQEFLSLLAVRDLGREPQQARGLRDNGDARNRYPRCAPIGAGMAVRRTALAQWIPDDRLPDRQGTSLSSSGDNDLVFAVLAGGWEVAYFPELILTHLIPSTRLEPAYLGRLNRGIQRSWMRVLRRHDANPWPPLSWPGARLRQAKAWAQYRAWRSPAAWVRWQGACGHFEGRVSE